MSNTNRKFYLRMNVFLIHGRKGSHFSEIKNFHNFSFYLEDLNLFRKKCFWERITITYHGKQRLCLPVHRTGCYLSLCSVINQWFSALLTLLIVLQNLSKPKKVTQTWSSWYLFELFLSFFCKFIFYNSLRISYKKQFHIVYFHHILSCHINSSSLPT